MWINGEWAEPGEDIVWYHAGVTHLWRRTLTHTLRSGVCWPAPGLVMSVSMVSDQGCTLVSTGQAAPVQTWQQFAGHLVLTAGLRSDITIFLGHEHVAHTNISSKSYVPFIALTWPWKQCYLYWICRFKRIAFSAPFEQAVDDLASLVMTESGVESGQLESLLT